MENKDLAHLNISEERIIKLIGKEKTEKIKNSDALFSRVIVGDKEYHIGYCDYKERFYTASILP